VCPADTSPRAACHYSTRCFSATSPLTAGCVETDLPVGRCNYARSDESVSETACLHHAMWVDHTETCCNNQASLRSSSASTPPASVGIQPREEAPTKGGLPEDHRTRATSSIVPTREGFVTKRVVVNSTRKNVDAAKITHLGDALPSILAAYWLLAINV
jgi:hypothetical protein